MKPKLITFLLIVLTCLNISNAGAEESNKSVQKECKKMAKQLSKEGWSVFGKALSIEKVLYNYYTELERGNGSLMSIEGIAKAPNINLAIRKSQNRAAMQYASMKETKVEGTTRTQISSISDEEASSKVVFDAAYQSSTEQVVQSMIPNIVFYRTLDDGTVEVRSLFLVKTL